MNKIKTTRSVLSAVVMAAALGLVACGGGSDSSGSISPVGDAKSQAAAKVDSSCGRPNFDADALAIINAKRAAGAVCGAVAFPPVAPLVWNAAIRNAATVHAQDLAARPSIPANSTEAHTGSDGSSGGDRMTRAGYAWSAWGEGVNYGSSSLNAAIDSQMASPDHCSSMMAGKFKEIGVSCINAFTVVNYGSK